MAFRDEIKTFNEAVRLAKKFIHHEDVNDIFFGSKYKKGKPVGEISIRFNVNNKKSEANLKSKRILPKKLGKFYTDVTDFKPKKNTREENPSLVIRPLIGGVQVQSSLFNGPSNWGTLGCNLSINGSWYGITNFHVAFGEIPDDTPPTSGLQMLQPKFRNFGEPIGRIINVSNKHLDYSLIKLNAQVDAVQSINGFRGGVEGFTNPTEGMQMFKFGAATGKTFGIFDARSIIDRHRIIIRYDANEQNDSNRISSPGDSGSMWVTPQNSTPGNLRMVALHYAGDQDRNIAFASLFSSISPSIRSQLPLT